MYILYRAKNWEALGIYTNWEDAKAEHDALVTIEGRKFYIEKVH